MLLLALCKKWIAVYVSQVRIKFKLKLCGSRADRSKVCKTGHFLISNKIWIKFSSPEGKKMLSGL